MPSRFGLLQLLLGPVLLGPGLARTGSPADLPADPALRAMVEDDWERQERRLSRATDSPEAIRDALRRGERILADLSSSASSSSAARSSSRAADARAEAPAIDAAAESRALERLRGSLDGLSALGAEERRALYRRIRWRVRDLALRNPLIASRPVAFLERRRFVCQMLHEYLGYYYDYDDIEGGSVCVLEEPGRSLEVRDLIGSRLPPGNFTTLALSYDARTIYFAHAPRAEGKPDYYSPARRCFHIHAVGSGGEDLRRLTDGPDDDFDPCPLPDGGIAFLSTRRGGFGRCHNPWEPLPAYTLHRMDADGSNVRTLSFHETNEWHPSVLADGRIVYSRWDYVDRSAAHFHGLWISRPDGSQVEALFGSYTQRINACFQPRAIPGSRRIVFVAGAHHAAVGGSLVIVDPARAGLDSETGEDRFDAIERLTPEVCYPEAPGWPSSYFHSPWPLSEDCYLVSFSFDPLPGMGPGVKDDTRTGIYLFDRSGNLEILYRLPDRSCMYPVPLAPRAVPPVLPSALDPALPEAELLLSDVRASLFPLPPSRPIRELRVFQVLPKSETHVANQPRIGYANAESARLLVGTVPVEADGSAHFTAPARRPLYFQAVDADGRAVQGMRSVVYLQPGERRGCTGCHEPPGTRPSAGAPVASSRPPDRIRPGPDGSRPWSYPRLMQTVLDARCVRCHSGGAREGGDAPAAPPLTGEVSGEFTVSYESLRPHVRWYEWGSGIAGFVTRPGRLGADESPLARILDDEHHGARIGLTDDERRRIYLWLDGNAAFYGAYDRQARLAQRGGEAVREPTLQ